MRRITRPGCCSASTSATSAKSHTMSAARWQRLQVSPVGKGPDLGIAHAVLVQLEFHASRLRAELAHQRVDFIAQLRQQRVAEGLRLVGLDEPGPVELRVAHLDFPRAKHFHELRAEALPLQVEGQAAGHRRRRRHRAPLRAGLSRAGGKGKHFHEPAAQLSARPRLGVNTRRTWAAFPQTATRGFPPAGGRFPRPAWSAAPFRPGNEPEEHRKKRPIIRRGMSAGLMPHPHTPRVAPQKAKSDAAPSARLAPAVTVKPRAFFQSAPAGHNNDKTRAASRAARRRGRRPRQSSRDGRRAAG